ncbi:MAG: branched-chain-amino-acid transaminase [Candidatus Omnitrophota bacterium]|nr:branched-chain-amino-acid transaminase [Candidatus Omnitrophota bacterium]MBU1895154.1 branched-chain-amino-acid transaminase [Candidatus Omnitrophota bacterium]
MGSKIFLNGNFVNSEDAVISVFDHGVLYGDGVFEGIRSYNRRVFRLKEHLDRLYASAEGIKLQIPMSKKDFGAKILETVKINDLNDAYIRVVVTRGIGDLGLDPRKCKIATVFIIAGKIALYPADYYRNGLAIAIAKTKRNHPDSINPKIKSLNYINNILGKIDAIEAGTQEALMLSIDGYVAECTGDNIFIVRGGKLITPPSEVGALEGITQKAVIELAGKKGILAEYKRMLIDELFTAEECFLTGTAAEIIPVVKIGDKVIGDGNPGSITQALREQFIELTLNEGVEY